MGSNSEKVYPKILVHMAEYQELLHFKKLFNDDNKGKDDNDKSPQLSGNHESSSNSGLESMILLDCNEYQALLHLKRLQKK